MGITDWLRSAGLVASADGHERTLRAGMHWASDEEMRHATILSDWFGAVYERRLVSLDGQLWFVKSKKKEGEQKRDHLAALLGEGWVNVAAVRGLTEAEFDHLSLREIDLPARASCANTYLVRFAADYGYSDLPLHDPDQALAFELVFSTWVRRRDAHSFNRVYKFGVPIFFDFGTAFLGEPQLADLDRFFEGGPDPGWPGLWRIRQAHSSELDTLQLRRLETANFESGPGHVIFPLVDRVRFFHELDRCREVICRYDIDRIKESIALAGYAQEDGGAVLGFLVESRRRIDQACERLRSVLSDYPGGQGRIDPV